MTENVIITYAIDAIFYIIKELENFYGILHLHKSSLVFRYNDSNQRRETYSKKLISTYICFYYFAIHRQRVNTGKSTCYKHILEFNPKYRKTYLTNFVNEMILMWKLFRVVCKTKIAPTKNLFNLFAIILNFTYCN